MRNQGIPCRVKIKGKDKEEYGLVEVHTYDGKRLKKDIPESFLQELLDKEPSVLPVELVDETIDSNLVSLGREISVKTGKIDNLFISGNGRFVVIETKLWRNPQARREAVSQVLDYATFVREWDYEKITALYKARWPEREESLWEAIAPEQEEEEWIDTVERALERGKMLLLVVGDGIRSRAEALVDLVDGQPDFLFRLGFVELKLFEYGKDEILVIPAVPSRTQEIERAVVRVVYEEKKPTVVVETEAPKKEKKKSRRSPMTEDDFREKLNELKDSEKIIKVFDKLLQLLDESRFETTWARSELSIKMPHPLLDRPISFGGIKNDGKYKNIRQSIRNQIEDLDDPKIIAGTLFQYEKIIEKFGGTNRPQGGSIIPLSKLAGREQAFIDALDEFAQEIEDKYKWIS